MTATSSSEIVVPATDRDTNNEIREDRKNPTAQREILTQADLTAKTQRGAEGGTSETEITGEMRGGTTGGWEKHQK